MPTKRDRTEPGTQPNGNNLTLHCHYREPVLLAGSALLQLGGELLVAAAFLRSVWGALVRNTGVEGRAQGQVLTFS